MQFLRDFSSSIFRICNLFDVGELLRLVYVLYYNKVKIDYKVEIYLHYDGC